MNNYAIDTAARFGDIPFVEFTSGLITGVFDSLVDAHLLQMEEYADFVASLTQDLSTYINNTKDGVTFDQISDFILAFDLPKVDTSELTEILDNLEKPENRDTPIPIKEGDQPATRKTWWGGLINALAPSVEKLVDKINDPNQTKELQALNDYNNAVLKGQGAVAEKIPTYNTIYNAVASLIVSNKYGILQTMARQGAMRLVVTEGEIETKITFSTWNSSASGSETYTKKRNVNKVKTKEKRGLFGRIFKGRDKTKSRNRTVTVNTAKSYQRDSSGTKVDIFGRVLIRFKTDYAPLNG